MPVFLALFQAVLFGLQFLRRKSVAYYEQADYKSKSKDDFRAPFHANQGKQCRDGTGHQRKKLNSTDPSAMYHAYVNNLTNHYNYA